VEEVLGFGLWSYWEAGWSPRLDDGDVNSNTEEEKLTAVGWVMKIAEDDGEVDEDFPRKSFSRFSCFTKGHTPPPPPSSIVLFFTSPKQRVENLQIQFRGVRRVGGQRHTRSVQSEAFYQYCFFWGLIMGSFLP
jgi:hypothetical protein